MGDKNIAREIALISQPYGIFVKLLALSCSGWY
jgi:hypothetical protein